MDVPRQAPIAAPDVATRRKLILKRTLIKAFYPNGPWLRLNSDPWAVRLVNSQTRSSPWSGAPNKRNGEMSYFCLVAKIISARS